MTIGNHALITALIVFAASMGVETTALGASRNSRASAQQRARLRAQQQAQQQAQARRAAAIATARQELAVADGDMAEAKRNYDKVAKVLADAMARLRQDFESSNAYTGAVTATDAAGKQYATARDSVLEKTKATQEYQSAAAKLDVAKGQLQATQDSERAAGKASDGKSLEGKALELADAVWAATTALNTLNAEALGADPTVKAAKKEFDEANHKLQKIKDEFAKSWASSPELEPLRKAVREAQSQLTAAQNRRSAAANRLASL